MKKITIKDVAREAGVSVATVSNALNNADVVLPKTREHVLAVAQRLNYIPNVNGRRLRGTKSRTIGLFLRAIAGVYYGNLAESMHYVLEEKGYELQIFITENVDKIIEKIASHNLDGAIVHCGIHEATDIQRLEALAVPVVFLDMEITRTKFSSVLYESFENGRMAAEYLLGLGHHDLMHIFGAPNNYDSIQRYDGFMQALSEAGVSFRSENLIHGRFERLTAYREMRRYLREGHKLPDAVFAANDHSAIGCIEALREAKLRVPEDISVIGCDDNVMCTFVHPELTTIRIREDIQARCAATELLRLISEDGGRVVRLPGSIIVRGTCRIRREAQKSGSIASG